MNTDIDPHLERSGISQWGYLIFLVFVLVGPALEGNAPAWRWALEITVVVSAIAIYIWEAHVGRRAALHAAIAFMAVALAATPFGSNGLSVLPVFAAASLASVGGPRQLVVRRLTWLTGAVLVGVLVSPVPWPYRTFLLFSAAMSWFVGLSVHEDVTIHSVADGLRTEYARLEYLATVTERERIARDLHDTAGQALTAMILRSQLVQRLIASDPERAMDEARQIESLSRDLLSGFRETVSGWQQVSLDDEIVTARGTLEAAGVETVTSGSIPSVAPSVETVLGLALRESVTNVIRHADARRCEIALATNHSEVHLSISDDGVGSHRGDGTGLRSMRERVNAAGGRLAVSDRNGTRIEVAIPIGVNA